MMTLDTPHTLDAVIDDAPNRPECQSWLNPFRQAGRERFKQLGWPDRRHEAWRYTNIKPILERNFVSAVDAPGVSKTDAARFAIAGLDDLKLVFVNGRFNADLSDNTDHLRSGTDAASGVSGTSGGGGVTVCKLTEAICQRRDLVEPFIGRLTADTDDAFTAVNNASIEDGVFVYVPRKQAVAKPIHILNIATATDEPVAAHPRNLIIAEEGAAVTVIEHYVALDPDAVYLNNAVTEVFAADHAVVHHYLLERESEAAFNISSLFIEQGQRSDVHSHTVLLGGAIVRNNVVPTLLGKKCHCLINGLYVAHGKQHLDNAMHVTHAAPGCDSRQFYKGIMNGHSRGVFTGRIVVQKAGQQTDAVQTNRNMLLSDDARANARPQLEIYADDVKCTHGATTGAVDPEAVFYFRSRGLSEEVARAMLIYAFAAEGFDRMELVPVRQLLAAEMIAKLPKAKGLSIEV